MPLIEIGSDPEFNATNVWAKDPDGFGYSNSGGQCVCSNTDGKYRCEAGVSAPVGTEIETILVVDEVGDGLVRAELHSGGTVVAGTLRSAPGVYYETLTVAGAALDHVGVRGIGQDNFTGKLGAAHFLMVAS